MRKRICLFLAVLLVFSIGTTSVLAAEEGEDNIYEIKELRLRVAIPNDMVVFTRDIADDDPGAKELGMDVAQLRSSFEANSIYLSAVSKDKLTEISITMSPATLTEPPYSYSEATDEQLDALGEEILNSYGSESSDGQAQYTNYSKYRTEQAVYLRFNVTQTLSSQKLYFIQNSTLINGQYININIVSYNDRINEDDYNLINYVIDNSEFTEILEGAPTVDHSTVYIWVAVGIGVVVIAGMLTYYLVKRKKTGVKSNSKKQ